MKKLIIPIGALLLSNLTYAQLSPLPNTENYIQTKTYLDYNGTSATKSSETVQYFDGLGRPKQIVNVKASPTEKDVVTHIEYDSFGRQVKDYLPIPQQGTQNGVIYTSPLINATQPSLYGSEKIYSEKILENSPLDRIQQQVQVGTAWDNKPIQFGYAVNADGDVKKYTATFNYTTFASSLTLPGSYGTGQLYKNTVTDEDGNQTIEFKNGKGQLLLVRKAINATENADTYYVYNDYDQLAFVIPPKASVATDPNTVLNDLCYQYKYDGRNRLVEKKIPGKGWEFMIYDKQDRLVGTQDAELRAKGQWLYTKYDQFGRVAFTGISEGGTRSSEQALANNFPTNNVKRTNFPFFIREGMEVFYDPDQTYPNVVWVKLLSVNYYDSYPAYSFNPAFPSAIQGEPVLTDSPAASGRSTKGLPVMSFVKNIEDDNWTKNYTYYDTKGRVIGSHSINHLGGYTHTESRLDFAGLTEQTVTKHKRLNTDTERGITETFEYDNGNRLLVHKHQVDSNPIEILTQNTYNEISQVTNKKVGGTDIANPLQSIDYKYNIRGWLTKINDPATLNGKLFGYEIKYQNSTNPSYTRFNGNISEVDWKTSVNDVLKRYIYAYDPLNRLTAGYYQEPETSVPINHFYNEEIAYDLNGNITRLQRNMKGSNNTPEYIDNIYYTYSGNRLSSASDLTQNFNGYPTGGKLIDYDDNGNMINHKDKNISEIKYNYLNLPYSVNISGGKGIITKNIQYIYRTDGIKVAKKYTPFLGNIETNYLDGFQYDNRETGETSLPLPPTLKFVPTSEGYFNFENNKYIYNYTDHLGNVRVSYFKNESSVEVIEENNYYPFGLKHGISNPSVGNPAYNYKYNGKELQETGMYDYGARFYMPDLGRWGVIDPLAEVNRAWSPYRYAYNNPLRFIDPDGRLEDWVGTTDENGSTTWHWDDKIKSASQAKAAHYDSYSDGKTNNTYTSTSGSEVTLKENGNWSEDFTNVNRERLGAAINNCNACKQLESVEKALFIGVPVTLATGGLGGIAVSSETTAISLLLKASGSAGMQYVGTGDVNIMSVVGDTFGAYGTGEVLGGLTELSYEKLRSGEPAFRTVFDGSMSWSEGGSNVGVALAGKGLTNLNGLTKAGAAGLDKGIINVNNYLIGTAAYKAAQIRAEEIKKK
ncbi:RHS repeat-associated protein [Chryseobacterium sediminis]|uniref:RHS repeat-associated protein n=1 Tax=Chryseobacterium sediminis TaxID=1679494 RepID=A0ABR6PV67_9FLAO|nr:DUF6443 domain-containing protein [Chryseobacterium sediminis]MBB6329601.1 RHS repeat-associated protein [Chryseobacterium sediminis]